MEEIFDKLTQQAKKESYAQLLKMEVKKIEKGYSLVEMRFSKEIENIFGMAHGGAIYSLLDEAFEIAANSHGTTALALNMNVTYLAPPKPGTLLKAEAKEICLTKKTGTYSIVVTDEDQQLIAVCQALVYRKSDRLPFL